MKKTQKSPKKGGRPRQNIKTMKTDKMARTTTLGIFNSWIDYTKQLENQVVDVLEENKTQYERLYNGWTDFSKSMGTKMTPTVGEDSPQYKELFNVWKNYSNKMGSRLNKLSIYPISA